MLPVRHPGDGSLVSCRGHQLLEVLEWPQSQCCSVLYTTAMSQSCFYFCKPQLSSVIYKDGQVVAHGALVNDICATAWDHLGSGTF